MGKPVQVAGRERCGLAGPFNAEIADRPFLSEQTVKTHVSRVFAKLSLRDRAQAVVVAYENAVVTPGG